jgi:hypothetical protein
MILRTNYEGDRAATEVCHSPSESDVATAVCSMDWNRFAFVTLFNDSGNWLDGSRCLAPDFGLSMMLPARLAWSFANPRGHADWLSKQANGREGDHEGLALSFDYRTGVLIDLDIPHRPWRGMTCRNFLFPALAASDFENLNFRLIHYRPSVARLGDIDRGGLGVSLRSTLDRAVRVATHAGHSRSAC